MTRQRLRAVVLLFGAGIALVGCGRSRGEAQLHDPDTASRLHVAATAEAAGQTDIALSMYAAAANAAPRDSEVQARYARLLLNTGKPDAAQQVLQRALVRDPNNPALLNGMGAVQLETGSLAPALQSYNKALQEQPRNLAALNGKGVTLDLAGQHAQAQQLYRLALAIVPGDIQSTNNLAISLLLSDRPMQAVALLAALAQKGDAPPRVMNNLAIATEAAGRTDPTQRAAGSDDADLHALANLLSATPMSAPANTSNSTPPTDVKPTG